jgi:metal-responsive CopG/Arc/MetJ family transcriptional regulator
MQTIAITIDDATLDRLERLSGREGGRNRSRLIREAVREYLERLERARDDEREAAILRRHRRRLAREASAAVRAQAKR